MARSVLNVGPYGSGHTDDYVREAKTAQRTKKARQKPIVKRRKAIAADTAPTVARQQNPLRPAPKTPYRFPTANGLLAPLGGPVHREDRDALKRRYDKALRDFKKELKATEARKCREARR